MARFEVGGFFTSEFGANAFGELEAHMAFFGLFAAICMRSCLVLRQETFKDERQC